MSVLIETTEGNLVIDLFYKDAPLLCFNFIKLCEINYFFFNPFYDLTKDLSITTGNPNYPEEEDGGESINNILDISVFDETIKKGKSLPIETKKVDHGKNSLGIVSFIAKNEGDKTTVGSKFLFSLTSDFTKLTQYNLLPFAKIVEGYVVLEKLNNALVDGLDSKRLTHDIRILHTHVLYDPFPEIPGIISKKRQTDIPSELQLRHIRIPGINEVNNDSNNKEEHEATLQALSLELIGDLPHYQMKPSPRTLFIAKLNPITTSDALSVVFGRFGQVIRSNIIIDIKTRKSLCYGFVEFNKKEEAESAYLSLSKGCYIDGRQVLVDFSQSVKNS